MNINPRKKMFTGWTAVLSFNKLIVRFAKEAILVSISIKKGISRVLWTNRDSRNFTEPANFHFSIQEIINNLCPESKRLESFDVCSINF